MRARFGTSPRHDCALETIGRGGTDERYSPGDCLIELASIRHRDENWYWYLVVLPSGKCGWTVTRPTPSN